MWFELVWLGQSLDLLWTQRNQLNPLWTGLKWSEPVWSVFIWFELVGTVLNQSKQLWTIKTGLNQFESVWFCLNWSDLVQTVWVWSKPVWTGWNMPAKLGTYMASVAPRCTSVNTRCPWGLYRPEQLLGLCAEVRVVSALRMGERWLPVAQTPVYMRQLPGISLLLLGADSVHCFSVRHTASLCQELSEEIWLLVGKNSISEKSPFEDLKPWVQLIQNPRDWRQCPVFSHLWASETHRYRAASAEPHRAHKTNPRS